MIKRLTPAAMLFLAACATVDQSPAQFYRPSQNSDQWKITGDLNSDYGLTTKRNLSVFINDQIALSGQLSESATGELSGEYNGHNVDSVCSSEEVYTGQYTSYLEVRCLILIDNERAATLTF